MHSDHDPQTTPPLSPARAASGALKILVAYLCFGLVFEAMMISYCLYRAEAGSPSDLPCISALWTSLGLAASLTAWPLLALDLVTTGSAVLVPSFLVRAVGIAWLGGFIAVLAWVFRRPRR